MKPAPAYSAGNGYTLLIVSIALANFMGAFDSTIVTIALPTIAKIFGLPVSMASWVITVYVLVMAALVLVFGKLSDRIGYKKVFLHGFAIFTVASFACGFLPELSSSFPVFIASRAVQAIGAVMFVSVGPAMISAYVPQELDLFRHMTVAENLFMPFQQEIFGHFLVCFQHFQEHFRVGFSFPDVR